ncbi:hypothetical protein CNMCM6106_001900 [Aspergillus hiratsukae]|uniref:AHC1-like C2H2 zinc-finger domain-containing protein n=1 Tax=Aspergillus hiratsukae TaxID=1194566 RepID=A0A8H6Q553_9EURO|nr:hypothetical protein CNMCM6106_001900 [Aspergillus hiratsukae]
MFRLLPWSSALGGNKVMAEELKMLAISPHCASPGLNSIGLPQLKRKRSDSSDAAALEEAPVATKLRSDDASSNSLSGKKALSSTVNGEPAVSRNSASLGDGPSNSSVSKSSKSPRRCQSSSSSSSVVADKTAAPHKIDVDTLRETLEAQLSLEVLLKHNELRLIDQEIAKCQVALEQLRRCAEIPYPGSHVAGVSQSLSNGTGMAVLAPGNGVAPISPAPWGVTDGPYTRHYARWLIPDPRFDGGELEPGTPLTPGAVGTPLAEGRSTRGNPVDGGYLAGKSRPHRGSAGAKLQSLPSGYPTPKEKAGPMIIRRKSDGVLVKLICLDCRRDNFSSTQGFINHCRIAHNRNFASHDAAAMASGEPVEVDEAGAVVPGKNETASAAAAGFVHPLIRSAHVIEPSTKTPSSVPEGAGDTTTPRRHSVAGRRASSAVETPTVHSQAGKRTTSVGVKASHRNSFTGSPDTPHLSSLMQRRGVGLDLDQLVGEAKTTMDLEAYSSGPESEDDPAEASVDAATQAQKPLGNRAVRQSMRTTGSKAASQRPGSRKGFDKTNHDPPSLNGYYRSTYGPAPSVSMSTAMEDLGEELSPTTLESNQAPSLVSDDDDYGAASEPDSPEPSSSEAGDQHEEFSHIDVEDDEVAAASTAATGPKSDAEMAGGAAHPSKSLSRSIRRGSTKKKDRVMSASIAPVKRSKDEKRVSFVSPNSKSAKGKRNSSKKSNGRKL